MTTLLRLPPGTRFRISALGLSGKLLDVETWRARVRIDGPSQAVEFAAKDGSVRKFRASGDYETSWAAQTLVEVER